VYKKYADAMAAGKKAYDAPAPTIFELPIAVAAELETAENAYGQAVTLAKTDNEKCDALVNLSRVLMKSRRTVTVQDNKLKTRTAVEDRFDEAYDTLKKALELKSLTAVRQLEIRLLMGDAVDRSFIFSSKKFADRLKAEFDQVPRAISRGIYDRIIASPDATPDIKAAAYSRRARTFGDAMVMREFADEFRKAFTDLKMAVGVAQASDVIKAEALFYAVDVYRRLGNANEVATTYYLITQLPNATERQRMTAYHDLADLLLKNNKIADARKMITEALALGGAQTGFRPKLHRLAGISYVMELYSAEAEKSQEKAESLRVKARQEFDKTIDSPGLTPDQKAGIFIQNAELLNGWLLKKALPIAQEQIQKVIQLKGVSLSLLSSAYYNSGESYRLDEKFVEALAMYAKITAESPAYYQLAQRRITEIKPKIPKP
jgi:tetratricopeptide (TPR) repeat protein